MSKEPLHVLFVESEIATYICYNCGDREERFCKTDKKFKSFTKTKVNKGNCIKCNSKHNLFKNPYGEQYWFAAL